MVLGLDKRPQAERWWSPLTEWLAALAAAVVVVGVACLPLYALLHVAPLPDPKARHEPPPVPGARVQTPYGEGIIVQQVAMWEGPVWQVRLDSGRYVVLYRADMRVIAP